MHKSILGAALLVLLVFSSLSFAKKKVNDSEQKECESIQDSQEKKVCQVANLLRAKEALKNAQKQVQKSDSPTERKARHVIARSDKKRKREEKKERQILTTARIIGCPENSVTVSASSVARKTWFPHVRYTIINTDVVPVDIRNLLTGYDVVSNLCPGGQITLTEILSPWQLNGNQIQVGYLATGRFPDGIIGIEESQKTTLSSYQSEYQLGQTVVWRVQLRKIVPRH